jgi:hypothetical protein
MTGHLMRSVSFQSKLIMDGSWFVEKLLVAHSTITIQNHESRITPDLLPWHDLRGQYASQYSIRVVSFHFGFGT